MHRAIAPQHELAGVLDDGPQRHDGPGAHEQGQPVQRRLEGDPARYIRPRLSEGTVIEMMAEAGSG